MSVRGNEECLETTASHSRMSSGPRVPVWPQPLTACQIQSHICYVGLGGPDNLRASPTTKNHELLFQLCLFTRWVIPKAIDLDETFLEGMGYTFP